jgi:Na+/citrate or Na+/malate symporter
MSTEFLEGVIAWILLSLLVVPLMVGGLVQGAVFLSAMFGSFLGFGGSESGGGGRVSVRIQPHDMDEDY